MNNTVFNYNKMAIFAKLNGLLRHIMEPLLVRTFGYIHSNPLHSSPGTKEKDIMLAVFLKGTVHFQSKKLSCEIPAGSIAFFVPDDPGIFYSDKTHVTTHYYCRFNGSSSFQLIDRIIKLWGSQIFKTEKISDILLILKKMNHEYRNELAGEMRTQEGYLFQILFLLLDKIDTTEKDDRHMKMIQYLQYNLDKNLNIDEMSKAFHLSVRHLNRLFKINAGVSICQYHEQIKINLSKTLLENTSFPVNEIALRVGFQDALYFSRVFKKSAGISPLAWRKQKI